MSYNELYKSFNGVQQTVKQGHCGVQIMHIQIANFFKRKKERILEPAGLMRGINFCCSNGAITANWLFTIEQFNTEYNGRSLEAHKFN